MPWFGIFLVIVGAVVLASAGFLPVGRTEPGMYSRNFAGWS